MEHSRSPRRGSFERRSSVPRRTSSPSPIRSPPSRSYTPSPSRGRPQTSRGKSSSSRLPSRSKSRGRPPSRSRSRSSSRSRRSKRGGDHHHGLFKTTAGLLAGIGVAAVVAHKVWPKGVLYGDHEDWEHEKPSKHRHPDRQHRRRRSVDNGERVGERVVERRTQRRGDAVYYEEVSHRRPQNYERMPRPEHERMRQPVERLPYPPDDHYVPGQPVYTERRRTVVQPVPMHPER